MNPFSIFLPLAVPKASKATWIKKKTYTVEQQSQSKHSYGDLKASISCRASIISLPGFWRWENAAY
jgi:hypothetical protein